MKTINETLGHERSTKNTELFTNKDNEFVTALYIKKAAFPNVVPGTVTITVRGL